jgi:PIN domain nuclease of toxin-antitoxin system
VKSYVVDTHALVWYLTGDRRLGSQAEAVLNDPDVTLIIPAIVLAEIKDLAHKGRFAQTLADVLAVIGSDARCRVYPIDLDVVNVTPVQLDIHDSLIVGVALVQPDPVDGVLTCDRAIISANLVSVVW